MIFTENPARARESVPLPASICWSQNLELEFSRESDGKLVGKWDKKKRWTVEAVVEIFRVGEREFGESAKLTMTKCDMELEKVAAVF